MGTPPLCTGSSSSAPPTRRSSVSGYRQQRLEPSEERDAQRGGEEVDEQAKRSHYHEQPERARARVHRSQPAGGAQRGRAVLSGGERGPRPGSRPRPRRARTAHQPYEGPPTCCLSKVATRNPPLAARSLLGTPAVRAALTRDPSPAPLCRECRPVLT